jgi:AraC-like DNA-binding protein
VTYREISPGPEAAEFVRFYWVLEDEPGSGPGAVQRVVPDGAAELILNVADPFESFSDGQWRRQPAAFLAGQITGPLLLRPNGRAGIVGVRFTAQGAGRLLGVPMHLTTDRAPAVGELDGALARALESAIDCHGANARAARVEAVLVRRYRSRSRADLVVDEAVRQLDGGAVSVGEAAGRMGISTRQLERRFRALVGLSPKRFERIRRFQRVFQAIERGGMAWAGAAADCRYFDQAHLVRDFREFAGEPPSVLLQANDLAWHFLEARRMSHFSKTKRAGGG